MTGRKREREEERGVRMAGDKRSGVVGDQRGGRNVRRAWLAAPANGCLSRQSSIKVTPRAQISALSSYGSPVHNSGAR